MKGYIIYRPSTNQVYHVVEGWYSAAGPFLRVCELEDCIRWLQDEIPESYGAEIHKLTATTEKVSDEEIDDERLRLITDAIETLPSFIQDLMLNALGLWDDEEEEPQPELLEQWAVASRDRSNPEQEYLVNHLDDGSWSCDCPDYRYRQAKLGGQCKHIRLVRNSCFIRPGAPAPSGVYRTI